MEELFYYYFYFFHDYVLLPTSSKLHLKSWEKRRRNKEALKARNWTVIEKKFQ